MTAAKTELSLASEIFGVEAGDQPKRLPKVATAASTAARD